MRYANWYVSEGSKDGKNVSRMILGSCDSTAVGEYHHIQHEYDSKTARFCIL